MSTVQDGTSRAARTDDMAAMLGMPMAGDEAIRLLLVAADGGDEAFLEQTLCEEHGGGFRISRVTTLAEAKAAVAAGGIDIIILDLDRSESEKDGWDSLAPAGPEVAEPVPVFLWTNVEEQRAVRAVLGFGDSACLVRDQLDHRLLPRLLRHACQRQRQHNSLRRLITTNPDGIVVVDFDGDVLFANITAARMFARPLAELLGHSFGFPVVCGDAVDISTRGQRFAEMRSVEIDWNGVNAFLVSLRDVTERLHLIQSLEIAKRQAESANRLRSRILSTMSHELRTPLNAIIGFSSLMLAQPAARTDDGEMSESAAASERGVRDATAEAWRGYLGYIHQSGCELLDMVNDVLDVAAVEAGNIDIWESNVDCEEIVLSVLRMVRSRVVRGQLTLHEAMARPVPRLRVDPRRFKQMLVHLLDNAIKFTPPGGMVRLEVDVDDRGDVLVFVSDTGRGMAEEEISHALAPFARLGDIMTTTARGAGLGLALVKGLIEGHGGTLQLKSAVGVGTVAILRFPACRVISET